MDGAPLKHLMVSKVPRVGKVRRTLLFQSVVPARISSQSSRHCWRSPLPHASALIQRDFGYSRPRSFHTLPKLIWCGSWGCNLDQSLSNHGPHVFYRRKIRRASRPGKQFNPVIDEEPFFEQCVPRVVAHYPVEIWLWPSPKDKEGQLAPTPWRCSAGCLKYRQCVLEECESDIQYHPIP
ncbi:uncharacterized protein TNCV_1474201 [Trichonephila clavipes]|nr:uncharacterized protein TNCV_1474201 [Trichonephila clavipes]